MRSNYESPRHRGLAAALLWAALGLLGACQSGDDSGPAASRRGGIKDQPAANFSAATLDNGTFRLSSTKNKVVLLNFWGIWCRPCRFEIPELVEMHRELRSKGLEIVGINFGDDRRDVARFVTDNEIRYPIVFEDSLMRLYNIRAFPTNIVIDREGTVRYISEGYGRAATADLRAAIEELL
jgi:thiol-disulfide isomerase/thioredoxin